MRKYLPIIFIFLFTALFYLPIFINPKILVARGNDLTEFFWPIFYFVRNSIFKYHELPFWNNLFFSGTPLLPDPQSPLFYLPNIIFLIFKNLDTGFIISVFIHIFAGGLGFYFLSLKGFKFSIRTSLIVSFLYISESKLSGFIEAGHFGLIASWAWLPFVFLSVICLCEKPTLKKSVLLSLSLAAVFYTHILIFIITCIATSAIFLHLSTRKNLLYFTISIVICFGLISIVLLPQISWQPETTRFLLLKDPDVYPKWFSFTEFFKATISPILFGNKFIWNLDTEKIISIGLIASILSFYGFLKVNLKNKILITISLIILTLISLNNLSPIYSLLIRQNWYILLRVSTRVWFLVIFIILFLIAYALENLNFNFLVKTLVLLAILESLIVSWTRLLKPIKINNNLAPYEIYEFLSNDKDKFRVFCLNRCLSQHDAAIYNLELADGYGTLQQKNYYEYSQQLSQAFYRNRYTLSIPPFEIYLYENLQPFSPSLASYRIKYVISDHQLKDKNLKKIKTLSKYQIYQNLLYKNPNYSIYTPNFIRLNISGYNNTVTIPEVYNTNWKAYLNGKVETKIIETPEKTREVNVQKDTLFIDFKYQPYSFLNNIFSNSH